MHCMLNAQNISHLTVQNGGACLGDRAAKLSIIPIKGKSLSDFPLRGFVGRSVESSQRGLGKPPVSLILGTLTQHSKMVIAVLASWLHQTH